MTDQIGALRRRSDPQDRALLDQLAAVNSQRAALVLKGLSKSDPVQFRTQAEKLEAEAGQLEAQISARSIEFRTQTQPVTIERVRQAIPVGAALVEIMSYRTLNPQAKTEKETFGAARYVAYVLRREGEPAFADLGEAAPIDRASAQFRTVLSSPRRTDVKQSARALDEMIMRPVRKLLGNTRTMFFSPDGALNLIPFSALVDEEQRYLVESYSITYLTSGRDLLRLQTHAQSRQGPVAIATLHLIKLSQPMVNLTNLRMACADDVPLTSRSCSSAHYPAQPEKPQPSRTS
jgi:CHAT domain-containing protein